MKNLKYTLLLFALLSTLLITACGDDDGDCVPPDVPENIIGKWSVSTGGNVEFKADGTLIDPDDALTVGGGLDQKTYVATNVKLTVTAQNLSGSSFLETDFDIFSNDCDQIVLTFLTNSIELNRR
jgi:hypothetical protein